MVKKLIIDADPGIGDALAVLTALVDPAVEVVGLTATAGTVSGRQATRNLQFLTELVDPLRHPRIGDANNLPGVFFRDTTVASTRHSFCGKDGLGDIEVRVPDLHNRHLSARLIVDLVHEHPQDITLLTLGPLTNLAAAFELDPQLPSLLQQIVILGGADRVPGDISPVAEFNIASDPEAARSVLQSEASCVLVPLDVSGRSTLTFEDVDVLSELIERTPNGAILTSLLQYALRAQREVAQEGIPLHSVTALSVATHAEPFSIEAVAADVEIHGQLTRGMTVIDRRPGSNQFRNTDTVVSVDEHGIVDYFSRSLKRAAG